MSEQRARKHPVRRVWVVEMRGSGAEEYRWIPVDCTCGKKMGADAITAKLQREMPGTLFRIIPYEATR